MTRTNAREIVAQLVYEMGFRDDDAAAVVREHLDPDYYATLKDESDAYQDRPTGKQAEYIAIHALRHPGASGGAGRATFQSTPSAGISAVFPELARAIMQLAMYECLYVHDVPVSAAINEAVELTRRYEDEDVVAFVNGILGAFAREVAAQ